MSNTTPYVSDTIPVVMNGVIQAQSPAQLIARFGSANTKTPTQNFSLHYNGHTLSFQSGVPFVTDPKLLAALTAINAPIV